jgi:hypothetical protein
MIYVHKVIGVLQTYPILALALGILILLIFLYKKPKTFIILAVVAVVIYLVFSLADIGTKQKGTLIKKSTGPSNIVHFFYYY